MNILKFCNCGKEFRISSYLASIGKGNYCSHPCFSKSRKGKKLKSRGGSVERLCKNCKKLFSTYRSQVNSYKGGGKYCSRKCVGIANGKRLSGDGHWNWKGGISPRILNTVEYREWRSKVFERDGFKCIWCGYNKGRILQADHIKSWRDYPKLRYIVSNGRTLCKPCHMKTETWGHH